MIAGDYTAEDFVLRAEMTSFSMLYLPNYVFECSFDAQWTASFGFDRFEEYTHWQRRYDTDLKRHIKEPMTRTKTVTDWVVHSGEAPGYCKFNGYAGAPELVYARRLVEDASWEASHHNFSVDLLHAAEPLPFEILSPEVYESVKPRVMDVVSREVKSYAQGDHQRDWRWTANIDYKSKTVYVPTCNAQLSYDITFELRVSAEACVLATNYQ